MATFKRKGARTSVIHEAVRREEGTEAPAWAWWGKPQWDSLPIGWWLVRFPEGYVAQLADDEFRKLFTEYISAPNV